MYTIAKITLAGRIPYPPDYNDISMKLKNNYDRRV